MWQLKLLDSPNTIRRKILSAFVYELNRRNSAAAMKTRLDYGVKTLIINAILNSPEYASLTTGKLRGHLGVPDGASRVQDLILQWINEFVVQVSTWRAVGHRIVGGFTVYAIKSDFAQVLNSPVAFQITEKGEVLPWLEWLLTKGDQIIIKDYYYAFHPKFTPYSRTGQGIMMSAKTGFEKSGGKTGLVSGGWRVPPEYSGTINNNWITRAIVGKSGNGGIRPQIRILFKQIVKDF